MAQVRIGLMVSGHRPDHCGIGIPQRTPASSLPRKIGDASVEYIQLDDGGGYHPRGVRTPRSSSAKTSIDALIGPSTTPNALAILDIIAENKVPMLAIGGYIVGSGADRRQETVGIRDDRRTTI